MPLRWAKSVWIFHNGALRVITPQTLTPNNVCCCWFNVDLPSQTLNQQCVNVSWLLDIGRDTGSGMRHVRWVEVNILILLSFRFFFSLACNCVSPRGSRVGQTGWHFHNFLTMPGKTAPGDNNRDLIKVRPSFSRCHVTTAPSKSDAMFPLTFNECPLVLFM